MIGIRIVPSLAGALVLLAGLSPLPAPAQPENAAAGPVVRVPCCRCVDGRVQRITINTRTAPWQVASPGSGSGPVIPAGNVSWTPVPPAGWVGPQGAPTTVGDYTYLLRIEVPRCTIPARAILSGRFGADNSARVFLNANQIAASQGTPNYGFLPGAITPFSTALAPGVHTLRVVVRNIAGPTAMILQGQITVTCPTSLEQ